MESKEDSNKYIMVIEGRGAKGTQKENGWRRFEGW